MERGGSWLKLYQQIDLGGRKVRQKGTPQSAANVQLCPAMLHCAPGSTLLRCWVPKEDNEAKTETAMGAKPMLWKGHPNCNN